MSINFSAPYLVTEMEEKVVTSLPSGDTASGSGESTASPPIVISAAVPYTEEEKKLLTEQLRRHQRQQSQGDDDSSWNETTLPFISSMVEKVLQLAAQNRESDSTKDSGSGDENKPQEKANATDDVADADAVSKVDTFVEDNDYVLEQLRLQPWPFFTLPRLCEILADPYKYNSIGDKLRGEKLQSAIRRCVLVSAPLNCDVRNNSS
ncbi:hypothetical protein, conserved [Trypanosoma brucei gambiense DAL972]|uniref:Uncharacterized protein n=2 Tax=Trypanosoma brucei TaxID=5691 RepID=C9ZJZ8_TRYB9|nr:hypothetical protein, conserved [Trypanosoma brucei gambiense DAL972]CBH09762.1 hypothetical protein, conserved [Trypanosoma brucei gambiense DAL972]|eukprot:XP_011772055.1 hypothetical protein, conserved [Trypanosoma brucei gambiense DAL972]